MKTDRTKTAMVAELDQGLSKISSPAPAYVIFWHPKYVRGQKTIMPAENDCARTLLSVNSPDPEPLLDDKYRDPVYGGWWLFGRWVAGFARVPVAHLVVVYQVRNRTARIVGAGGVVSILVILVGLGSLKHGRLRARSTSDR